MTIKIAQLFLIETEIFNMRDKRGDKVYSWTEIYFEFLIKIKKTND